MSQPVLRGRAPWAFDVPTYRWLWLNSLSTSLAWVVESLSLGWLLLQLTDSSFWVGAGAGIRGFAQFLFAVPGGTLVDRVDRRRLLLFTQAAACASVMIIALLVLHGAIRLWHIVAYMILGGLLSAVEKPGTTGLMYDVIGVERLLSANALRFAAASLVRIAGALAGGFIIDRLGVGKNYLLASGAYLLGFGSLLVVRSPRPTMHAIEPLARAVGAGLRYAMQNSPIRSLLLLSLTIEGFAFSYFWMLPVMARDVLKVGGTGLGYLAAAGGFGQLVATLLVASRGDVRQKGGLLLSAAFAFGAFVALFGLSPIFIVSLALVACAGAAGITYDSSMATVLPTAAADDMRGRVLGLYASTIALSQLGGLAIGTLAALLGAPAALVISGGIASTAALAMRPRVRLIDRHGADRNAAPAVGEGR